MTTFDQFAVTDGSVTAESADGEQVTFDAALTDRDDVVAGWEPLVADWLQAGDGSLSFETDGSAVLSRDRVLSATRVSPTVSVGDRRGAAAVLGYLDEENVVTVDDDRVTLLRPFEEVTETHTPVYNNWAAVLGVLVERIDLLVSRIEATGAAVEKHDNPTDAVSVDIDALGRTVERLDTTRSVLIEHRDSLRTAVLDPVASPKPLTDYSDQLGALVDSCLEGFPTVTELATTADATVTEVARHVLEQVTESLSSLSNTFSPAAKMEDEDLDDFIEDLDSGEPDSEELEEIDPISEEDEDTDGTTEDAPESE